MRLQFCVDAPDLGFPDPMAPDQIDHLVTQMEQRLSRAGYGVTLGSEPHRRTRSAPHAWSAIIMAATARDPRFQPIWLPQAVEILRAAGRDVHIDQEHTADLAELATPSFRGRLRRRFRGGTALGLEECR